MPTDLNSGGERESAVSGPAPNGVAMSTGATNPEGGTSGSDPSSGSSGHSVTEMPTVRLAAPSLRGVVRILLIAVACGIALYLLWRVRGVVRLVGISLFLALALIPVVDALDSRIPVPRAVLILGVYVVLIVSVVVIGYVVVPSLVKQVGQLSHDAPRYAAELRHNGTFRHYDNRYHITPTLVRDARRLPHLLGHLVGPLKDVTVQAFTFIGQLLTVLAITFLLVLHGRQYVNLGLSLTGSEARTIGG